EAFGAVIRTLDLAAISATHWARHLGPALDDAARAIERARGADCTPAPAPGSLARGEGEAEVGPRVGEGPADDARRVAVGQPPGADGGAVYRGAARRDDGAHGDRRGREGEVAARVHVDLEGRGPPPGGGAPLGLDEQP